nr:unnamed protein product [Digitaria exilis]
MAGSAPTMKAVFMACMLFMVAAVTIAQQQTEELCVTQNITEFQSRDACVCSRNCACAGKCLFEDDPPRCFTNCALKNGCVCGQGE